MIRLSVRSAGLAILLTMSGCGLAPPGSDGRTAGLNVAEAALLGGSGQIALHMSEGVLGGSPNNARALAIKGDALSLLGDHDGAAAVFQELLAKDPTSVRANIGLGRLRLGKDPAAAEALFLTVLKHDPRNETALNNLGIARDLQGRHAEAQTTYRQVLSLNPDLDSAKVNMALSMAMSGQGSAAVDLLKAQASQPGAPLKIKHDYAIALAMAGRRGEAEVVLSENLPSNEVRRVLDNVTGVRSATSRDSAPGRAELKQIATLQPGRRDDDVPPDVVQVPETPNRTALPATRMARGSVRAPIPLPGEATAPLTVTDRPRPTIHRTTEAAVAAPLGLPPMIVRPQPTLDPETATPPVAQPVDPVAAAVTYQRPLSLPIKDKAIFAAPAPVLEDATVVAMPPPRHVEPSAYRPVPLASRNEQPVARPAPVQMLASLRPAHPDIETPTATNVASTAIAFRSREESATSIQFAAAPSEESARAYWSAMVRRFPEALGQREPTVVRYERDGTVFWRVRTEGFSTTSEARALCSRLRSGGQDYFVPRS